jgi:hypothetical protein
MVIATNLEHMKGEKKSRGVQKTYYFISIVTELYLFGYKCVLSIIRNKYGSAVQRPATLAYLLLHSSNRLYSPLKAVLVQAAFQDFQCRHTFEQGFYLCLCLT